MKIFRLFTPMLVLILLTGCIAPAPYDGPAKRYLPIPEELPVYFKVEDNIAVEQLLRQAKLDIRKENAAYASFANSGFSTTKQPQNGVYLRLVYTSVVLNSATDAAAFLKINSSEAQRKQNFLVIMPAAVQQSMGAVVEVPLPGAPCDEAAAYKVSSAILFTPDLYLYALCRVENVTLLFWGHTPDNYDGNNAPIPDAVIAQQVSDWLKVAAARVTAGK